ncbi:MAG: adaptor protein MecA [Oscillospiraceae bacterium]|jgi:hypothetical protein|nr:adaptor protein MecA [Oscillospiraceae bacterium]
MRIEAISRRKIIVELGEEDLSALDITYDDLDYSSIETRRVIWVILDRVRETTGCDIDPSGQLLIDAMPSPAGGCILFFTLRGGCSEPFTAGELPERILRKQDQLTIAFDFTGIDALLDCANAYAESFKEDSVRLCGDSELYRKKTKYRLLLIPAQEPTVVKTFFSEYGSCAGEEGLIACRTREFWTRIGGNHALEELVGRSAGGESHHNLPPQGFKPGSIYVDPTGSEG